MFVFGIELAPFSSEYEDKIWWEYKEYSEQ